MNLSDKGSLHQWFQGVFFALYNWNLGPLYGTEIDLSVVAINRKIPYPIEFSLGSSIWGNSEGHQSLDYFESAYLFLFRQRDLFNILVYERRLIHRDLHNKVKLMRDFDTEEIMVVRNQLNSIRKYGVSQKLIFRTKWAYRVLEEDIPISYWLKRLPLFVVPGKPRRKVKEPMTTMEHIISAMVFHKNAVGADNIFANMSGPLVNNPLGKCLVLIRKGTWQAAAEDSRWAC